MRDAASNPRWTPKTGQSEVLPPRGLESGAAGPEVPQPRRGGVSGDGPRGRGPRLDLDLDRKTVRRLLQLETWRPYDRAPQAMTLLTPFAVFLAVALSEVRRAG